MIPGDICHDQPMRRLLPQPVLEDLDLAALADHYAYPVGGAVRANMVTSVDGAVTMQGRSRGVSNAADWRLFGLQRALADAIVVGAGTARAEGYGPGRVRPDLAGLRREAGLSVSPRLVLVSRTAALDPEAEFFGGTSPTVVVTCASAGPKIEELRKVCQVLVCGDHDVDLATALTRLREQGLQRILTEGGPHLLGSLLTDDLLDEVAWSVTPATVGGDSQRMVSAAAPLPRPLRLRGILEEDGTLFLHYRRAPGEETP